VSDSFVKRDEREVREQASHLLLADDELAAFHALAALNEEQRQEVMALFCRSCGRISVRCQCDNDD